MILLGDCLERLKELEDNSVDSVVTDPPYGLKFMGKKWDYDVPNKAVWCEVLRVLKPGGHLLSFGGTRTYHRLACAIEDAGFEIRDQIQWLYGSGFPKSHDISKGIDKAAGAEREVVGETSYKVNGNVKSGNFGVTSINDPDNYAPGKITAPATDAAKQWQGWGTALKPANEPIVLARKPLEKGLTVAQNVLKWGVGGLNIDASRISTQDNLNGGTYSKGAADLARISQVPGNGIAREFVQPQGRWPANLLLDETAAELLDEQSGVLKGLGQHKQKASSIYGGKHEDSKSENLDRSEQGGASRFFYCAKASKSERNLGMGDAVNNHCTVKPIKLMEYLIRLITPHGGLVLDPFMGSGSTGVAAFRLGFKFIGCEMNQEYVEIAEKRMAHASAEGA